MIWVLFLIIVISLVLGKIIRNIVPEEKNLREKIVPYILFIVSLIILGITLLSSFDQWLALSVLIGFVVGYFLKEDHAYLCLTALSGNLVLVSLAVVYGLARGFQEWSELWVVLLFLLIYTPISMNYLLAFGATALFATNVKVFTN